MAGTKKLYHQDAYLREFCAKVLSCTPCPDGRFAVALDETAFYPEGGGQPADHGALGPARPLCGGGRPVPPGLGSFGPVSAACGPPLHGGAALGRSPRALAPGRPSPGPPPPARPFGAAALRLPSLLPPGALAAGPGKGRPAYCGSRRPPPRAWGLRSAGSGAFSAFGGCCSRRALSFS